MVKKVLAAAVVLLMIVSGAWAEDTSLTTVHRTIVDWVDGKPDYSTARFLGVWVAATKYDAPATLEDVNLTGSMTLSGGNYSFWDGKNGMRKISGTPHTFGLSGNFDVGGSLEYMPRTASGDLAMLCIEADGGLNGVNVSWNFSDKPSYNGQGTFPSYRTTQQQLDSYVPYVEYVRSGSQVTGLRLSMVSPNNTSEAVNLGFAPGFRVFSIRNRSGSIIYSGQWTHVEAGNPAQLDVTFDSPINESDISTIRIGFRNDDDGTEPPIYQWYFCKPSTPNTWLYENHTFTASLVNGKSDYSNAKFHRIFFDVQADENITAEARHFTAEGSMTIPGGGYTLGDNNAVGNDRDLGVTIPAGTDKTYKLRMYADVYPGDSWVEYQPVDENGVNLDFRGGAENLAGRTLTWTFPAELGLSGSAKISSFKSASQFLASAVPYVELVSADGKLTAVHFRMVTSSDTSTALTLPYRTNFRLRFDRITPDETEGTYYNSSWMYNTSSGTWTLDKPQDLSNMDNITVRFRSWEDPDNSILYQWQFGPSSAYTSPAITTSSLPNATVNTPYTTTLATNISGAIWSISSGTLPRGLNLTPTTGIISGTPTSADRYTFTVKAESATQSAEKSFTLTVSSGGKDVGVGSGGGCNGLGVMAALALAFILSKKR